MSPRRTQYRIARSIRTTISVVTLVVLSLAIIDYAGALTPMGRALAQMQILPAMAAGAVVWLALWAMLTLFFGRVYCSTVCPVGTVTDIVARVARIPRGKDGLPRVYRYMPPLNRLRLGVLVVTLIAMIVGILSIASVLDPFSAYARILSLLGLPVTDAALGCIHRFAVLWLSAVIAALSALTIIVLAAWRGRLLCNSLCPAGTLLGLVSNHALMRMEINTDLCTNCRACEYACKAQCIDLNDHVVDASRCIMCMNCTDVCPDDAISYRNGRHTLSLPMLQTTMPKGMQTSSPQNNQEHTLSNETISRPAATHPRQRR